jgi:hypothetical protein
VGIATDVSEVHIASIFMIEGWVSVRVYIDFVPTNPRGEKLGRATLPTSTQCKDPKANSQLLKRHSANVFFPITQSPLFLILITELMPRMAGKSLLIY